MRRLLRTYLATINDDHLIIDYSKVRSEELTFIDGKDPVACYAQSHDAEGHLVDELNAPFANRKADIDRRILVSSQTSGKALNVPKPVIDRFVKLMLTKASIADIKALAKPVKNLPMQARYCRALEAEYDAAVRLPCGRRGPRPAQHVGHARRS